MSVRAPLAAVAIALLLLSAGCAAPGGSPSTATDRGSTVGGENAAAPTADPTATTAPPPGESPASVVGESERVAVEGNLPVDATRVYRRVERLMGVSAAPPTVRVTDAGGSVPRVPPGPVEEALGFGEAPGDVRRCGPLPSARARGDEVFISPGNASPATVELVLAHEYVHTLQSEVRGSPDSFAARARGINYSLSEGAAVYVAEAYSREYGPRYGERRPLEWRACLYRESENGLRRLAGEYYFGGRHFAQRLDSPAGLSTVFTDPPRTTEQLVHGETPATEPAAPLTVRTPGTMRGSAFRRSGGELLVRTWLSTALPASRVDAAATGWGNDTVVRPPGPDRDPAVAWVLRWDTERDAAEFLAAARATETELESRNATSVRPVRVSPETVVVFAGPPEWVADATAEGTNATVTVRTP